MSPSDHALQVHYLLRTFERALYGRIADIDGAALTSGPDALAGRVIARIFEDGIGVIGHFAGQIEANLTALGIAVPPVSPALGILPVQDLTPEPGLPEPTLEAARGSKLLEIENVRVVLLGAYSPDEMETWRAYPARVYGAGNGTLPPLTESEQAEFTRLSRIDQIDGYAAQLRERVGRADTEAELAQITIADGWP